MKAKIDTMGIPISDVHIKEMQQLHEDLLCIIAGNSAGSIINVVGNLFAHLIVAHGIDRSMFIQKLGELYDRHSQDLEKE